MINNKKKASKLLIPALSQVATIGSRLIALAQNRKTNPMPAGWNHMKDAPRNSEVLGWLPRSVLPQTA